MRYNRAATAMDTLGPINNLPEVLRTALKLPVTVVEGERQIACIVSVAFFEKIERGSYLARSSLTSSRTRSGGSTSKTPSLYGLCQSSQSVILA